MFMGCARMLQALAGKLLRGQVILLPAMVFGDSMGMRGYFMEFGCTLMIRVLISVV